MAYLEMTLSQCAAFDKANSLSTKLTGWGIICRDRFERNLSVRGLKRRNGVRFQKEAK